MANQNHTRLSRKIRKTAFRYGFRARHANEPIQNYVECLAAHIEPEDYSTAQDIRNPGRISALAYAICTALALMPLLGLALAALYALFTFWPVTLVAASMLCLFVYVMDKRGEGRNSGPY